MNRYREPASFERCQRMAAEQGLTVWRCPLTRSRLIRRYAITRADRPLDYAPIIVAGLQALTRALKTPEKPCQTN